MTPMPVSVATWRRDALRRHMADLPPSIAHQVARFYAGQPRAEVRRAWRESSKTLPGKEVR